MVFRAFGTAADALSTKLFRCAHCTERVEFRDGRWVHVGKPLVGGAALPGRLSFHCEECQDDVPACHRGIIESDIREVTW